MLQMKPRDFKIKHQEIPDQTEGKVLSIRLLISLKTTSSKRLMMPKTLSRLLEELLIQLELLLRKRRIKCKEDNQIDPEEIEIQETSETKIEEEISIKAKEIPIQMLDNQITENSTTSIDLISCND